MSDHNVHRDQAKHNENLASDLLTQLKYKDWVITVSFYAALHYVEAGLSKKVPPIQSDSCIPADPTTGRLKCSAHTWREDLVSKHYKTIYVDYRQLRSQSQIARYLCSGQGKYIPGIAQNFFNDSFVQKCFNVHLKKIKMHFGY